MKTTKFLSFQEIHLNASDPQTVNVYSLDGLRYKDTEVIKIDKKELLIVLYNNGEVVKLFWNGLKWRLSGEDYHNLTLLETTV